MRPDTDTHSTCICLDSSFEADLNNSANCKCKPLVLDSITYYMYYNTNVHGCITCPSGLSPDSTNTYCVCLNNSYFSHV